MMRSLLLWLTRMFGTPRLWAPHTRYLEHWPAERPGKSGVAAIRRQARKLRQRRARRA
ncbi:hypothetical protein D9M68_995020 [compost metagenome]